MLSYGCSPVCVNGFFDHSALNFSAVFMQTVISLSQTDETRDEAAASDVWARAFARLNAAAHEFHASPTWRPPPILGQLLKSSAIETYNAMDDENSITALSSSDSQLGEADVNSAAALLPPVEDPSAVPLAAPPLIETLHTPEAAPQAPAPSEPGNPGSVLKPMACDPVDPATASPAVQTSVLSSEKPPPSPTSVPLHTPQAAPRSPAPSEPGHPGSALKPTACDPADPATAAPAVQTSILSSKKPPPSPASVPLHTPPAASQSPASSEPGPALKPMACAPLVRKPARSSENPPSAASVPPLVAPVEKRVHFTAQVAKDDESESSLSSADSTAEDEGSDHESEDSIEISQMSQRLRAKRGQPSRPSELANGRASGSAVKTKHKMAQLPLKKGLGRMGCEFALYMYAIALVLKLF